MREFRRSKIFPSSRNTASCSPNTRRQNRCYHLCFSTSSRRVRGVHLAIQSFSLSIFFSGTNMESQQNHHVSGIRCESCFLRCVGGTSVCFHPGGIFLDSRLLGLSWCKGRSHCRTGSIVVVFRGSGGFLLYHRHYSCAETQPSKTNFCRWATSL